MRSFKYLLLAIGLALGLSSVVMPDASAQSPLSFTQRTDANGFFVYEIATNKWDTVDASGGADTILYNIPIRTYGNWQYRISVQVDTLAGNDVAYDGDNAALLLDVCTSPTDDTYWEIAYQYLDELPDGIPADRVAHGELYSYGMRARLGVVIPDGLVRYKFVALFFPMSPNKVNPGP